MFKKFMMKELVIHSKQTKEHGTIEYFVPYWLITSGVVSLVAASSYFLY